MTMTPNNKNNDVKQQRRAVIEDIWFNNQDITDEDLLKEYKSLDAKEEDL
tara:strand:- start:119 stop:268 length:150 start_codon:yes stop_codon:yes gene_type:complete